MPPVHVVSPLPHPAGDALGATIEPRPGEEVGELAASLAAVDARGAPVTVASADPHVGIDRAAAAAGFVPVRELLQLRRPLPVPARPTITVRAFRPGEDDDAWVAVNNDAFAWHPEQGGWDVTRLRATLAEPWVDLDGFVVHDADDGGLDGFCWTKVHPGGGTGEPPLGEIYVIGVSPRTHQRGLGRQLVLAGLDHLADIGLTTAMLWVDADNAAARRLYDDLGFGVHQRTRWYRRGADSPDGDDEPATPSP